MLIIVLDCEGLRKEESARRSSPLLSGAASGIVKCFLVLDSKLSCRSGKRSAEAGSNVAPLCKRGEHNINLQLLGKLYMLLAQIRSQSSISSYWGKIVWTRGSTHASTALG